MDEVTGRPRSVTAEAWVTLVDHAFTHQGGDERDAGLVDHLLEDLGGYLAVGAGADHQVRVVGVLALLDSSFNGFVFSQWATVQVARDRQGVSLLGRCLPAVPGASARFFFFRQAEGFTHARRYVVGRGELVGVLGDGVHHAAHVDDLEATATTVRRTLPTLSVLASEMQRSSFGRRSERELYCRTPLRASAKLAVLGLVVDSRVRLDYLSE